MLTDFFVIPSIEDNLPNTVMESLSCGTPVIGFNIGGIPDMVIHNKTGLLVDINNEQDFINKLELMIGMENYMQYAKEEGRLTTLAGLRHFKNRPSMYLGLKQRNKHHCIDTRSRRGSKRGGSRNCRRF